MGRFNSALPCKRRLHLTAGHFLKELCYISRWIFFRARIACCLHAGSAAKDVHLQTGIVGKAVKTGSLIYVIGLLLGVGPEGIACFGDVFRDTKLGGGYNFKTLSQNIRSLTDFMYIVGCKN